MERTIRDIEESKKRLWERIENILNLLKKQSVAIERDKIELERTRREFEAAFAKLKELLK